MKIVIDIPDDVYNDIKSNEEIITYVTKDGGGSKALYGSLAIINGTILPKGHGRLIDGDELYKQDKEEWLCPQNAPFISTDYAHVFAEIDQAPTIIEADKESNKDV